MNDVPPDSSSDVPDEWGSVSLLPIDQIRDFFVRFGKAFRGFQLYEKNNPVYLRFMDDLRTAFADLWEELDELAVTVEELRFTVEGQEVLVTEDRADSIPFLFYKDGLRELHFTPGFEESELEPFLEILLRARREDVRADDLLTLFWDADLQHFRYRYVDVQAESVAVPEAGGGAAPEVLAEIFEDVQAEGLAEGAEEEDGVEPRVGQPALDHEELNPTLYSLDPRELEQLNQEIDKEVARDLQGEVLASLFDRLEEPRWPERQSTILRILHGLFPSFLGRGAFEDASRALDELYKLESQAGVFDEQRLREVHELVAELSAPETIEELVRTLEDGSIEASSRHLPEYLAHLSSRALIPLLRASEEVSVQRLQPVLRRAATGIAQRHQGALVKLLRSEDEVIAAAAARLVGALQVVQGAAVLPELLRRPEPSVRLAAVQAASGIKASLAAKALQDALDDSDGRVRVAAARALGKLRYRPAAERLRDILTSSEFKSVELSERIAFFEAYVDLGDPGTLTFLDKILNGRGLLGRRETPEQRACAALALGRLGTREALNVLSKAAGDENPVVKSAVSRAMRDEVRKEDRHEL